MPAAPRQRCSHAASKQRNRTAHGRCNHDAASHATTPRGSEPAWPASAASRGILSGPLPHCAVPPTIP
eukprot:15470184-Alexandrium_andersonii.AAC.1